MVHITSACFQRKTCAKPTEIRFQHFFLLPPHRFLPLFRLLLWNKVSKRIDFRTFHPNSRIANKRNKLILPKFQGANENFHASGPLQNFAPTGPFGTVRLSFRRPSTPRPYVSAAAAESLPQQIGGSFETLRSPHLHFYFAL